jgi:hypothetical protein
MEATISMPRKGHEFQITERDLETATAAIDAAAGMPALSITRPADPRTHLAGVACTMLPSLVAEVRRLRQKLTASEAEPEG